MAWVRLADGYLGMGREVQAFEGEIAEFFGVPRDWVICVNSSFYRGPAPSGQTVTRPGDEVLV